MKHNHYLPITITLQVPKALDGQLVKTLTMRPPICTDVLVATTQTQSEVSRDVLLFANLTDTTPEFIGSLEFYDYKRVEQANDCFLVPVQQHLERRSLYFPEPDTAASTNLNSEALPTSATG